LFNSCGIARWRRSFETHLFATLLRMRHETRGFPRALEG
jgi:hypothetical protein